MKVLFILVAPILLASLTIHCGSSRIGEWQVLTKQNFSSQIRLHPHILLLVTLPWSGESRSLMKDVTHVIDDKLEEFGHLKLMFMNRNTQKMLADSIGVTTEEVTVFYIHYSIAYKYRGRLRAKNILSSLYHCISVAPEEIPLKALKTPEELRVFLDSTDKALVLVDFCGWTPKLLAKRNKNGTEIGFNMLGDQLGMEFNGGSDKIPASKVKNNQKVAGVDMCKAELSISGGFSEVPWLKGFASSNESAFEGARERDRHVSSSCDSEEFERFHSFYLKFMTVVREFFLPPEQHRFGLVSERSMLSSLGVGDSGSWFGVHFLAGCPSCSKILKEGDDLKHAMGINNYFVKELEGNGHDEEVILPANKASVVLFVDRLSDSSEARGKSKEALDAFRKLAHKYHVMNQTGKKGNHEKFSVHDYEGWKSTSEHPRLTLSMTAQKVKLKGKSSSVMIINDGKPVSLDRVASDLQLSSLNEVLGYLLQQKKDGKLSSLAKNLGFQLLSDDVDIKSVHAQQLQSEAQLNQISKDTSQEGHTDSVNMDEEPYMKSSVGGPDKISKLTEISSQHDEVKTTYIDTSKEREFVKSEGFVVDQELLVTKSINVESEGTSEGENSGEEQAHYHSFNGSFFYSDGNYQLLKVLTGGCRIPSLVIVDPLRQQHYVFPEEKNFNFTSLYCFLFEFRNGTLLPYQRSEHVLHSPREATRPPFVNLNFHEVDSVPRITAHAFSELVIGFNLSDKENRYNAWNKDVLVLFSNSWCGFCQRMEMVVREVYRAFKGYIDILENGSRNAKAIPHHESLDYIKMKLPAIYLLDCTLNDCSLILKSVDQREVYPALVLFPAETKKPLLYEGDMAVVDVIKFVTEHGTIHHHLSKENVLWLSETVGRNPNLYHTLKTNVDEESLHASEYHGGRYQDMTQDKVVRPNLIKSHVSSGSHEMLPRVVIGSVLIATEKLLGIQPFDGTKILIVAADQITGFQGLIINKHLDWSSLLEVEEGLEILKEAALSYGGPVVKSELPLLALTKRASRKLPEVLPGLYLLDQLATIREIEELKSANQSVADYWFFLGYSSWSWNQLFNEMIEGAWNLSEDGMTHLNWP